MVQHQAAAAAEAGVPQLLQIQPLIPAVGYGLDKKAAVGFFIAVYQKPVPDIILHPLVLMVENKRRHGTAAVNLLRDDRARAFKRLVAGEGRHGETCFAAVAQKLRVAVDEDVQPVNAGHARREIGLHLVGKAHIVVPGQRSGVWRRKGGQTPVQGKIDAAVTGGLSAAAADFHHKGREPVLIAAVGAADIKML